MRSRGTQFALPKRCSLAVRSHGTPLAAMLREVTPSHGRWSRIVLYFGTDGRGGKSQWRVSDHEVSRDRIGPTVVEFRSLEDELLFTLLCAFVQRWIRQIHWTGIMSFCRLAERALEPDAAILDDPRPVSDKADGNPLAEGVHDFFERTKATLR